LMQLPGRRARNRRQSVFHRSQRTTRRTRTPPRGADGLRKPRVRRSRRPGQLWRRHYRRLPSGWRLRRPYSQRRKAWRAAGTTGHKG
jgi:hypothetical protein